MTSPEAAKAARRAELLARRAAHLHRKAEALTNLSAFHAGRRMAAARSGYEPELRRKLDRYRLDLVKALAKVTTVALAAGQTINAAAEREGFDYVQGIAEAAGFAPATAKTCATAAASYPHLAREAWRKAHLDHLTLFDPNGNVAAVLQALAALLADAPTRRPPSPEALARSLNL